MLFPMATLSVRDVNFWMGGENSINFIVFTSSLYYLTRETEESKKSQYLDELTETCIFLHSGKFMHYTSRISYLCHQCYLCRLRLIYVIRFFCALYLIYRTIPIYSLLYYQCFTTKCHEHAMSICQTTFG